ncbi:uncharacterized protein C12orf43-like protein [Anopheles sinensis]|uniref:Uncharacterized protein C12orf43-like protein n=1 Tax=Anopheles sinensis TaxID=74873 RepID=A0A084WN37_ANOSI|nr:uncharacterized protein C12orf43-like protein [Anopheles sinensis]
MLSMMLETLQTLNSTSQENEMTIVKPGTSYQKANTNAAKLKPDFGSNKSIKRQITQKNATNNKPKKQKNPTSGSSVIKQTGPMMPSTNPMNDLIVASMIPKIESAKIVETTTQLATVNTPIATHKKQNEPRPCTSVVKPKPPSQSEAYPKPDVIIPSRVYTNKKKPVIRRLLPMEIS